MGMGATGLISVLVSASNHRGRVGSTGASGGDDTPEDVVTYRGLFDDLKGGLKGSLAAS